MTLKDEAAEGIEAYQMHVSARYLELTRKKLELTRLPRELELPEERRWDHGTPKTILEPIVDYWMEEYDWRAQETIFNNNLPQFRATIGSETSSSSNRGDQGKVRLHFTHKRSPAQRTIPLLFCHGWPPSFTEVIKIIEPLSDPISTPPRGSQDALGFHVVAPSIPGFGFSDISSDESFGLRKTAEIFDTLMKQLGYQEYVAYGGDWGFKICRMLALHHQKSCRAIYTNSPDMPIPTLRVAPIAYLKYQIARLTKCRIPFLRFGYIHSDILATRSSQQWLSTTPFEDQSFRPQTTAHSLCDSPVGLLACMLDAIRPSLSLRQWSNTDILNWTMMHWLPGPEAALRWLRQASLESRRDCWTRYSQTPLGISSFGKLAEEQRRSPPPWADGWQRLCWLRRHERAAKWPAWDAPDEMVMDLRDCFGEMIERRLIELQTAGVVDVD